MDLLGVLARHTEVVMMGWPKNFTLAELTVTSQPFDNTPGPTQLVDLQWFANTTLQTIRDRIGVMHVTSGFRSEDVNDAVGGSKSSDHLDATAIDFIAGDLAQAEVWWVLIDMLANGELPYVDQLILYSSHIHVGARREGARGLLLSSRSGRVTRWTAPQGPPRPMLDEFPENEERPTLVPPETPPPPPSEDVRRNPRTEAGARPQEEAGGASQEEAGGASQEEAGARLAVGLRAARGRRGDSH